MQSVMNFTETKEDKMVSIKVREEPKKEVKSIIQQNFELCASCYDDDNPLTIEQYKANYKKFTEGEDDLKAALRGKKIPMLKTIIARLGGWTDSRHKKEDLINKIVSSLEGYFYIGRAVVYTFGEGNHLTATQKLIEGTTAEDLNKFYIERRAEIEKKSKAKENPETIEEFQIFCQENGKDKLTPEQSAVYEGLLADRVINRRKQEEEQKEVVQPVEVSADSLQLHKTKHSKTGADIFTVRMMERVDKPTFADLRTKSKQFGGYYSRFTNYNAEPKIYSGFNFKTEENALSFMGLTESAQNCGEVKEARKEEKAQTTAEAMRERGLKMIEKAEEGLNQERRTNTHRQASQAASAESKLRYQKTTGQRFVKIADGLEAGTIKYLSKLNNAKQLEQLDYLLRRAYESRTEWADREAGRVAPNAHIDVNHVVYPYPVFYTDSLKSILLKHEDTSGLKRDIKKVFDYCHRHQDKTGKFTVENTYIIELFKSVGMKLSDKWDSDRILSQIKDLERLQKMGLTNLALLKTAIRELSNLGKGTGLTPEEKKIQEMKELERSFIGKKIDGFFPTPKPLIEKMFSMARVFEGETILEPSAGLGHIAEEIQNKYPSNELNVVEFNYSLWEALEKKGFSAEHINFLATSHKYDVIFMNPPFEKYQDIDHVLHAFKLLKKGGRLVAIVAGSKSENSSSNKVREFVEFVNKNGYFSENEDGAFKSAFRSTSVSTTMVYLEKSI